NRHSRWQYRGAWSCAWCRAACPSRRCTRSSRGTTARCGNRCGGACAHRLGCCDACRAWSGWRSAQNAVCCASRAASERDRWGCRPCPGRRCSVVPVGWALLRVVLPPLAVKVRAVAVIRAVCGLEALVRGPGLDERAVDREMLVRQQRLDLWVIQKPFHELPEHIAALKPVPVFGEAGRIPDWIIGR